MKYLIYCFLIFGVLNCFLLKNENHRTKFIKVDFSDCLIEDKKYRILSTKIPRSFKREYFNHHGFCEFRFTYPDSSVFYLSSDIYRGSRANFANVKTKNIDTYMVNRRLEPIDTIKNYGIQSDGKYWLEYILGDYVVGYSNASPKRKPEFDSAIESVTKTN